MKKTVLTTLLLTMGANAEILNEVSSLPTNYNFTNTDCNGYIEENLFVLNTGGKDKKHVIDHTETTKYVCKRTNASQKLIDTINKSLKKLKRH